MTTVALINQKGGVGKTTAAVNLSACMANLNKSVLTIDFDPQKNMTCTLNKGEVESRHLPSLYNVFLGDNVNDVIIKTPFGIDLIPSNNNLSDLQIKLTGGKNQNTFLRDHIKRIFTKYDYAFIDCPPTLNIQTINALMACDKILIPVTPSNYAIQGLTDIIRSITQVKSANPDLEYYVFISRYDSRRNISHHIFSMLVKALDNNFLKTVIRENVDVEYSQENSMPLIFYNNTCNAAQDYKNLTEEILRLWETK